MAEYVRRERFKVQRHAAMFMEPRGFVADWDGQTLTVRGAAKTAWYNRRLLAASLRLPTEAVELIELDVVAALAHAENSIRKFTLFRQRPRCSDDR